MADLQHGWPSHRIARHQARSDEGLADLLEKGRFLGIGKLQLGAGGAAARCVPFGDSWLNQAQEQGARQPAMLLRREGSVGGLRLSDQGSFDSAYLLIGLKRELVAMTPLEELLEGEL